MSTLTLVLHPKVADDLAAITRQPLETAAVMLARPAALSGGGYRLLGVQLCEVPPPAYLHRSEHRLSIASEGYVPALGRAAANECVAIWVHTHPGDTSSPNPSGYDLEVDQQLLKVFAARTGTGLYGALITAFDGERLTFTGHIAGAYSAQIRRIFIPGSGFELLRAADSDTPPLPRLHDRHVRAFGPEIPRILGELRIAVIGCGGTGSAVAEQLVRLGVRDMILVDPETLDETNTTRVYGSTEADEGLNKVDILDAHLRRIAPDMKVTPVTGSVCQRHVAQHVVGADVVFGCTDDDAGRLRLSRFSFAYLTPLIDCGVQISATGTGEVDSIIGRVTVLYPGAACLLCRQRVCPQVAAAQEMPRDEYERRHRDGYVPDLPDVQPAVIAFTTATAAAAVNELLERLVGYGRDPAPSELLLRIHDRSVSTNHMEPRPQCYCVDRDLTNFGDTARYWGLEWPA